MYSLQSSLLNRFPYWKHDSSDKAIWFYGSWKIGYDKNIGTDVCGIFGPHGIEKWPNNISLKWEFYNGTEFKEAAIGEIVFEDCTA